MALFDFNSTSVPIPNPVRTNPTNPFVKSDSVDSFQQYVDSIASSNEYTPPNALLGGSFSTSSLFSNNNNNNNNNHNNTNTKNNNNEEEDDLFGLTTSSSGFKKDHFFGSDDDDDEDGDGDGDAEVAEVSTLSSNDVKPQVSIVPEVIVEKASEPEVVVSSSATSGSYTVAATCFDPCSPQSLRYFNEINRRALESLSGPAQGPYPKQLNQTTLNGSSPTPTSGLSNMNTVGRKRGLFSRGGKDSHHAEENGKMKGSSPSHQMIELDEDRFNGDGVMFHGKMIGHEYVAEARGEQMCQQSLKKLKIIQKALGGHKRRIQVYISFDGIKIQDAISGEQLFHHTVPQISFISRDETDTRAFGYVFGNSTTGHQFVGIKTKKEAMVVMSTIGQLFAITLKRKRSAEESAALTGSTTLTSGGSAGDDPLYHSVADEDTGGFITSGLTTTNTSTRSRGRLRTATTSSSGSDVPIPALPPPDHSGASRHRGKFGTITSTSELARSHLNSNSNSTSILPPPPQSQQQQGFFSETGSFPVASQQQQQPLPVLTANPTVALSPPTNNYNTAAMSSNLTVSLDAASFNNEKQQQPITRLATSYDWANFDDDPTPRSIADDSTLQTISSLSDMNVLSTSSNTLTGFNSNTNHSSLRNCQTQDSSTLVARSKNAAKNSSNTTIDSANFDGLDPFSDAFGEDPFSSASTTADISSDIFTAPQPQPSGITSGFQRPPSNLSNYKNPPPVSSLNNVTNLNNSIGNLSLDSGKGQNLSSSFANSNFKPDQLSSSQQSTSSADRYAALADIHSISTSIFTNFPTGSKENINNKMPTGNASHVNPSNQGSTFQNPSFPAGYQKQNAPNSTFYQHPNQTSALQRSFTGSPSPYPGVNGVVVLPPLYTSANITANVQPPTYTTSHQQHWSTNTNALQPNTSASLFAGETSRQEFQSQSPIPQGKVSNFEELDPLGSKNRSLASSNSSFSGVNMRIQPQLDGSTTSSNSSLFSPRNCSSPNSLHQRSPLASTGQSNTTHNSEHSPQVPTSTPPPPPSVPPPSDCTPLLQAPPTSADSSPSPEVKNRITSGLGSTSTTAKTIPHYLTIYPIDDNNDVEDENLKPEVEENIEEKLKVDTPPSSFATLATTSTESSSTVTVTTSGSTVIGAKSITSSISSLCSSLMNVSSNPSELKFETSFDEVFSDAHNVVKCTSSSKEEDEDKPLVVDENVKPEVEDEEEEEEEEEEMVVRKPLRPADSFASDHPSLKSGSLSSFGKSRSLSRQSSCGSAASNPPAVPPRTDLSGKLQTPPPLPPPSSTHSSSSQSSRAPHYQAPPPPPPPYYQQYHPYGGYGPPPAPGDYYVQDRRYHHQSPNRYANYYYDYYGPPGQESHYATPRPLDPYASYHYAPPPPPPPHPYDHYYHRQSPYQAMYGPPSPYAPPLPPESIYGTVWGGSGSGHPPPPGHPAHHAMMYEKSSKCNSAASTPPPVGDVLATPPLLAQQQQSHPPPLPNPQRRVSGSSSVASYGRSPSSASCDVASSSAISNVIPPYPPPPPPVPTSIPSESSSAFFQEPSGEGLFLQVAPQASQASFVANFNANMEQMIQKYHYSPGVGNTVAHTHSPLGPRTPLYNCHSSVGSSSSSSGYSTSRGITPLAWGQPRPDLWPSTNSVPTVSPQPSVKQETESLFDDNFTGVFEEQPQQVKSAEPKPEVVNSDGGGSEDGTNEMADPNNNENVKQDVITGEPEVVKISSPPERNIFVSKEDPFEDDPFFKS